MLNHARERGPDRRQAAGAHVRPGDIRAPSNQADTWSNVWTYSSIPSVRDILVVHGSIVCAELLRRQPDGSWPAEPQAITDGDLALDSIGLQLPLAALYRKTPLAQGPDDVSQASGNDPESTAAGP